jgi:hypothetical protein
MIKTIFSILAGAFFASVTLLLVCIYWSFSLLARIGSFVLLPLRGLFSSLKSS